MYNKHNISKLTERIFVAQALKGSIVALGIFILAFTIVPVLIAEASAESAEIAVSWQTVSMLLDPDANDTTTEVGEEGHGDVVFGGSSGITPVENNIADSGSSFGRLVVTKKRIGVATSGTYFSVYLSMAGDSSNSLIMDNTNLELEATSGTWESPKTFAQNGGTGWGFAVPGANAKVTGAPDFSTSSVSRALESTILDQQLTYNTTGAETYYANSVWAAVPTKSSPQLVWKESNTTNDGYGFGTYTVNTSQGPTPVVSPHNDVGNNTPLDDGQDRRYQSFDIYYAVAVDTNVVAGTYTNNIVYTGLAAASSLDDVSTNLNREVKFGGQGDVQTIRFDLNDSASSVTADMVTVALVPHSTFATYNSSNDTYSYDYDIDSLNLSDYDAEGGYADKLSAEGLSTDFQGLSTWLLGQEQPAQFLAKGQSSYFWGSKRRNDTDLSTTIIENNVNNNSYSAIPRSYDNGLYYSGHNISGTYETGTDTARSSDHASTYYGKHYNWYSATAESGAYNLKGTSVPDSICAYGWQLPNGTSSKINKSWSGLLSGSYEISENTSYFQQLTSVPISLIRPGTYNTGGGTGWMNTHGYYYSSYVQSAYLPTYLYFSDYAFVPNHSYYAKSNGLSIRCVNKGTVSEPVVATCAAGSICYNNNGGSGTIENQAAESNSTATLAGSTNITKDGYTFAGWSTSSTGYGDVYQESSTISTNDLSTSGLQLYAKWLKASSTMQGFTATNCSALATHQTVELIDVRDNNSYGSKDTAVIV